ncbi:MAG TPA: histidine kinase [Solirubrobacteraceae bacterium]|jgi:two-component system sensor histidine kinase KdpD|nr:histidine kinase [Solirubrobacteraceae bacterium]
MSEAITAAEPVSPQRASNGPRRGRLKVFLGMAAGVGKTFRMLIEGRIELEAGRDVVVGLLETHGRAETAQLAEGLPILPRVRVTYRQTVIDEMDLRAILVRAPEICLIDELAHTNAPGSEHPKRYEDVEDILAAGIDVLSTLNVQHLESLNDHITELSGVRVRETIPDAILGRADEVVLIDLTPEALLDRLRAGKIYPSERIDAALNNFFRIENLAALREVALRQVAEEVGAKRLTTELVGSREESLAADAPQAVGERLLALVEPYPGTQRLVRRAWRSAQRLGAELDLLWVRTPGQRLSEENERSLSALRQLASVLGAKLFEEESDDLAAAVVDVASRRGTTYILVGRSRPAHGLARLRAPLPQRLMQRLPGVDVRIVADRSARPSTEKK